MCAWQALAVPCVMSGYSFSHLGALALTVQTLLPWSLRTLPRWERRPSAHHRVTPVRGDSGSRLGLQAALLSS